MGEGGNKTNQTKSVSFPISYMYVPVVLTCTLNAGFHGYAYCGFGTNSRSITGFDIRRYGTGGDNLAGAWYGWISIGH